MYDYNKKMPEKYAQKVQQQKQFNGPSSTKNVQGRRTYNARCGAFLRVDLQTDDEKGF